MLQQNAGIFSRLSRWDASGWQWLASHVRWVALVIFLGNVALKLPYLAGTSLFLDEAVAIYDTQGTVGETIAFSANDPTPPLFYLVLGLWCKVFGLSEMSARFPSMLFSAATAAMMFWVGQRHFNVRVGIFAALIFSVSTIAMVFAHEARSYALAGLLMVTSYHFFLHIVNSEKPTWAMWLGLVIANTCLLYTHYLTSMGIATQALLSLWLLRGHWRTFLRYVASQAIVLMLWLPWVFYNRSHLKDSKVTSWLKPPNGDVLNYVFGNFAGSKFLIWFGLAIMVSGAVAAVYALLRARSSGQDVFSWSVLGAWFFVSLSLQFVAARVFMPVFDLRYVMYALPGGILFLAACISFFQVPRLLQYGLVATQLFVAIPLFDLNPPKMENWRDAISLVKEMENEGTAMIVLAHYEYVPFSYYYNREYFKQHDETTDLFSNDRISFGQDTILLPEIDDSVVTNIIMVLCQEQMADPQGRMFAGLQRKYCIGRRGAFPGVRVYQFQKPPCKPSLEGHFEQEFAKPQNPEEAELLMAITDTASADGRGTFVGHGHEFGATRIWKVSDIYDGHFSSVELKVRGKLLDAGKKVVLVYTMEHDGASYQWEGLELQQRHGVGEWFDDDFQIITPIIKDPDDIIKIFFWSPDGGGGEFDKLEVDFWEG